MTSCHIVHLFFKFVILREACRLSACTLHDNDRHLTRVCDIKVIINWLDQASQYLENAARP